MQAKPPTDTEVIAYAARRLAQAYISSAEDDSTAELRGAIEEAITLKLGVHAKQAANLAAFIVEGLIETRPGERLTVPACAPRKQRRAQQMILLAKQLERGGDFRAVAGALGVGERRARQLIKQAAQAAHEQG